MCLDFFFCFLIWGGDEGEVLGVVEIERRIYYCYGGYKDAALGKVKMGRDGGFFLQIFKDEMKLQFHLLFLTK